MPDSTRTTTTRPVALTAAQAQVLAAQRADPGNAAYNVGQYTELTGQVDLDVLQDAVRHTLGEAPWLHFRVLDEGGRFLQEPVPFDAERWRLPRLDTSGADDPTAAAVELVREQLACPPRLDLLLATGDTPAGRAAPSLTGAVLVTVAPQRHLLFQYFHHLAVDGYGVALLTRRIAEVYTARLRGTPLPVSPFAPVTALVEAERAYRDSERYAVDRAHWAARYADGPAATRFVEGSAPPSDTALRHTVVLDRRATAAIGAAARTARATWAEAVAATVAVQLRLETGTDDAVLAMYTMARTAPGTLRVPGMAVNILPVRVPMGDDDTFGALLGRTAREFAGIRAHQRFRGEEIARELWPGRGATSGRGDGDGSGPGYGSDPGATAGPGSGDGSGPGSGDGSGPGSGGGSASGGRLPGPLLNLRPFDTELDFAGVPGHIVTLASGPVDDFSISAVRFAGGRLRLDFDANPALYDEETLTRHARRCADLLRRLSAAPTTRLADIALLDNAGVIAAIEADDDPFGSVERAAGHFGEEAGGLPLLPSAHRLRESGAPVERLQDSVLLQVPGGLGIRPLRRALSRLACTHASLRLRLHRVRGAAGAVAGPGPESWSQEFGSAETGSRESGKQEGWSQEGWRPEGWSQEVWSQEVLPSAVAPAVVDPDTLRRVDIDGVDGASRARLIAAEARAAALALDPARGVVLRAVWFDAGPDAPGRLLLTGHRLAVDDASWAPLIVDLAALHATLAGGREPPYATVRHGLRSLAAELLDQAHGRARATELSYWRGVLGTPGRATTAPTPGLAPAPEGPDLEWETVLAGGAPGRGPGPAGAGALDGAVLGALALAAVDEPRLRGDDTGPGLLVAVEPPRTVGTSGPVGGLTTIHPVRIDPTGPDPAGARRRAAGALARVPDGGRGHEQLRHLNAQTAPFLADAPRAVVRYTRLGADHDGPEAPAPGWARVSPDERAALRAALAPLGVEPPVAGPLELRVRPGDGSSGPVLRWRWAGGLFTDVEARALTTRITDLITTAGIEHGGETAGTTHGGETQETPS
ncbi:condensation domain-containing protein [Streptomyces sp. NPDC020965]|uniref:condensation domain-containing protein n=1 Tax=Streptomyces sp. NPDC020965 TaxID=3365105 RepID=UPI003787DA90